MVSQIIEVDSSSLLILKHYSLHSNLRILRFCRACILHLVNATLLIWLILLNHDYFTQAKIGLALWVHWYILEQFSIVWLMIWVVCCNFYWLKYFDFSPFTLFVALLWVHPSLFFFSIDKIDELFHRVIAKHYSRGRSVLWQDQQSFMHTVKQSQVILICRWKLHMQFHNVDDHNCDEFTCDEVKKDEENFAGHNKEICRM